jgi:hypothetical protein
MTAPASADVSLAGTHSGAPTAASMERVEKQFVGV